MQNKIKLFSFITALLLFHNSVLAWDNSVEDRVAANNTRMEAKELAITHNRQGITFLQEGYPLHAINEFKIGIMLNPNSAMSADLYNNLGRSYEMVKAYDNAITSYEHAIQINPNFALYYKNLINAYKSKKTLNQALANYEKIVKLNPEDAQAQFILGLIYMEKDNKPKAIEALKMFLTLEPNLDLASAAQKYIDNLNQ
ncbi:MAG: tetratricopeptide repeat protein [Vampirovibrionia bacterium]